MATTPFLMRFTSRIRQEPKGAVEEREAPSERQRASALVVGYGRFGQTVAQTLIAAGIPVTLIDTDVALIDLAQEFGAKVYFGDGTRLDLLRQAGAGEARLILFCIDRDQVEPGLLHAVREAFPQASICVRAFDRRSVIRLHGAPVDCVVREVLESAVAMAREGLDRLGLSESQIDRAEATYRRIDKERLQAQGEAGDLRVMRDRILTDHTAQPSGSS